MIVLFDLDGTLLDSEKVAREARNIGFQAVLGREVTPEEEAFFLGKPVRKVLAEWFGNEAEELSMTIRTQYAKLSELIQPYPGVKEMLHQLNKQGFTLGIVSSKRNNSIERELKLTGLAPFFQVIVGQDDTLRHKPDPEPLLFALDKLNTSSIGCTYIGDQPTDIMAAREAGMSHIAAVWGDGDENLFRKETDTVIARSPKEILECLYRQANEG